MDCVDRNGVAASTATPPQSRFSVREPADQTFPETQEARVYPPENFHCALQFAKHLVHFGS
jgi:hypothetical protein